MSVCVFFHNTLFTAEVLVAVERYCLLFNSALIILYHYIRLYYLFIFQLQKKCIFSLLSKPFLLANCAAATYCVSNRAAFKSTAELKQVLWKQRSHDTDRTGRFPGCVSVVAVFCKTHKAHNGHRQHNKHTHTSEVTDSYFPYLK